MTFHGRRPLSVLLCDFSARRYMHARNFTTPQPNHASHTQRYIIICSNYVMFYDIFSACETCLLFVAFNGMRRQGRIKVRGGPRLDTVMGPYPFSFLIKLSSTTHTEVFGGIVPVKFKIANARM